MLLSCVLSFRIYARFVKKFDTPHTWHIAATLAFAIEPRYLSGMRIRTLALALGPLLLLTSPLRAWEKHTSLMPAILSELPGPAGSSLARLIQAPCPDDDRRIYQRLAKELRLNPTVEVKPTDQGACIRTQPITGREIITAFVDEPDEGMDQNLPGPREEFDPQDAAKWMGGTSGPTSAGFRHMYFGGWQLWHPIHTFQIPAGAIGYAPERAALMANKARELIAKGGVETAWGYRVLAWSIHYLQDLSQPFHAVQIPHLNMVPWYALLQWPPSAGFADLVKETTRTIANYHWSFEHYTYYRLTAKIGGVGAAQERHSVYAACMEKPDKMPSDSGVSGETRAVLLEDPHRGEFLADPRLLAERVAKASVQIGAETGAANMKFFGPGLKDRSVDIPNGKGERDYAEMNLSPDLVDARAELTRITCRALGNASVATRTMIQYATQ
jgi:hypothetical protein